MKINRKVLSMTLGGVILPWGSAGAADRLPLTKPTSGRLTDTTPAQESTIAIEQRPVLSLDRRPEAFRDRSIHVNESTDMSKLTSEDSVFHSAGYATSMNESSISTTPIPDATAMVGTTFESDFGAGGCANGNCASGSCAAGTCGMGACSTSSSCSSGCGIDLSCGSGRKRGWLETEALLWWGPAIRPTTALVASGPRSSPPNTILFGEETPYGQDMVPGLRTNLGIWLDDCDSIGIGGRAFGLFAQSNAQFFESNGSTTLGVPYFDVSSGTPTAYLVAFDTTNSLQGTDTGSITVTTDTDFISAEAYGRLLLARSGCSRADIVGGYTFARLDDSLNLSTRSVDGIVNLTPDGTVTQTTDTFGVENTFHGGHIGFLTDVTRGRLSLSTLGKVAIGTMEQRGFITGQTTVTQPNQNPVTDDNGLLSYSSNGGLYDRNIVSFLPEAGAKLRYRLKQNLTFNVGYTFLYLPDVVKSVDMIDTNLDVFGIGIGQPVRPAPRFQNTSYHLHGIDLGLNFTF